MANSPICLFTVIDSTITLITMPGSEFFEAGHFNRIDLRVDRDLHYSRPHGKY
jgi:hypothetical protein